jgi:hypothetical protein
MQSRYHIEMTRNSLGSFFAERTLLQIARANVGQDSLSSFLGQESRRHVCNCTVAESLAYIEEEHAQIAQLADNGGNRNGGAVVYRQRAALGRLLHTVQDFYAHTNYVALWVAEHARRRSVDAALVELFHHDGMDAAILENSSLQVAQWSTWREPFYYVPILGRVMRQWSLPASSHEAIHLDSPRRGVYFYLAVALARKRTVAEYGRAVQRIRDAGGHQAVARFHGTTGFVPELTSVSA